MATDYQIKTALERAGKAIELRPDLAYGTMKSSLRLEEGLKCVYHCGDWRFELDEPEAVGGDESAPTPGTYGLAALSACVAMSTKMLAVLEGITVDSVNVDIEADYDDNGLFGDTPIPPAGFTEFSLDLVVESSAPEERIRKIVDKALGISSWHGVFAHGQSVKPRITVRQTEPSSEA